MGEGILLGGVGEKVEEHVVHGEVGGDRAGVIAGEGEGMSVAAERDAVVVVDEVDDAVGGLSEWSLGGRLGLRGMKENR